MSDPRKFKNDIVIEGDINLPSEAPSRALIIDATGDIASSVVTDTELSYLSGVTSSIQDQLDAGGGDVTALVTLSGVPVGSTDLGTFTGDIIPDGSDIKEALQALETEIGALPNPIYYAGTYDAATNTPALSNADVGVEGALRYVTVAGTQDFGAGPIEFAVGDKVVNNGTTWDKWDNTDNVVSVNGQTGLVVLDTDDVLEGVTNLYHTDERAQDAVGTILVDSDTVSLTYDDATPSISAEVISQMSIVSDALGLMLEGDEATPGNTQYYGTDAAGVKGFHAIPAVGSPGDIQETEFAAADSVAVPAPVTGLAFAAGVVRAFTALVSVEIDATADLFEQFTLQGINKNGTFNMSVDSVGDNSGIIFSIDGAGQVSYTSGTVPGFVSSAIKFRAQTLSV